VEAGWHQVVSRRFAPQGVTALALLAESHASLHTYPEAGLAFWDCFTCGVACDPARSAPVLIDALQPAAVTRQEIAR
jgi:S-adenosylmethionine decarboxylase